MPLSVYSLCDPGELGLDPACIDDLRGRIAHAVDKGPLPAVQVALAREGRLALFETFGEADNSTRFNIYSCTKPLVASAIWKLMGEGKLDVLQLVCDYIPEFSGSGKERVTVGQLLCHTAGFPQAPMGPPDWWLRPARIARMEGAFCASSLLKNVGARRPGLIHSLFDGNK